MSFPVRLGAAIVFLASSALAQMTVTPMLKPAPQTTDRLVAQSAGEYTASAWIDGSFVVAMVQPYTFTVYNRETGQHTSFDMLTADDRVNDTGGGRVVWEHFAGNTSHIFLTDISNSTSTEIAPFISSTQRYRSGARIGANTVAWQEKLGGFSAPADIFVHDLSTAITTRLTSDDVQESEAFVSPSGALVTWSRQNAAGTGVWKAERSGASWATSALTSAYSDISWPATDGETIAYVANFPADGVVVWQSAAGGTEYRLPNLGGPQWFFAIKDGLLIVTVNMDPQGFQPDLFAYDLKTNKLYRLTNSPCGEVVTDVEVDSDGMVSVTYVGCAYGAKEAHLLSFRIDRGSDTEPPAITCPADIHESTDPGSCSKVVTYAVSATDNEPGVSISSAPASGASFPVGTTAMTAIATDAAGNTASCSFAVTITDAENPRITALSVDKPVLWPPDRKMVDVAVTYDTVDNCAVAAASLSVSNNETVSGDYELVNPHLVRLRADRNGQGNGRVYVITVTATDVHGNSSTKSVTVTVPKSARP